jgi:hypothetical protein
MKFPKKTKSSVKTRAKALWGTGSIKDTVISFRVPAKTVAALEKYCARYDVNRSELLKALIDEVLKK